MFSHIFIQIHWLMSGPFQSFKWLTFFLKNLYISNSVYTVIRDIIIFIIIADQIILSLLCSHLIRCNNIFPYTSIFPLFQMHLLIRMILCIFKQHFLLFANGFIQYTNIIKHLLIVRPVNRQRINVLRA